MSTTNHVIEIAAIDHVVLRSADPERLVRFYREVLGCPEEKRQPNIGLIQLRAGSALIDILDTRIQDLAVPEATSAAPHNMDHFCLRLAHWSAEAIAAHLRAHGVEPGEVMNRYGAEGSGPSIYLADPDGNTVELKAPLARP